jgi:hypothetical protein
MIPTQHKKKLNPMLMKVIIVSIGLHAILGLVAGVITIATHVIQEETQFDEPPAIQEEVLPADVKVQIKPPAPAQQKPALSNLKIRQVGNIAVKDVSVDLPSMNDTFTISTGLGGISGGNLLGGARGTIGMGISNVSVFGLKTRAERILFVIDTNRHMVTDKKGGLNSYKVIKDEITDMVGNLSAGTLFNVMLYEGINTKFFKPQLVPAGAESHMELVKWIAPLNADANQIGIPGSTRHQLKEMKDTVIYKSLYKHGGWNNSTIFITQATLEQDVDAIFVITGYHRGIERARRALTDKENAKWTAEWERTKASSAYKKQMALHNAEIPEMKKRVADTMAKINKERASKGQPPRVLASAGNVYHQARELGLKWKTLPINPSYPVEFLDEREVSKYYRNLLNVLYREKDTTPPSVNVVLFLAGDEAFTPQWEKNLKSFTRMFSGNSRIIRGLDEIKSARSSANTRN